MKGVESFIWSPGTSSSLSTKSSAEHMSTRTLVNFPTRPVHMEEMCRRGKRKQSVSHRPTSGLCGV